MLEGTASKSRLKLNWLHCIPVTPFGPRDDHLGNCSPVALQPIPASLRGRPIRMGIDVPGPLLTMYPAPKLPGDLILTSLPTSFHRCAQGHRSHAWDQVWSLVTRLALGSPRGRWSPLGTLVRATLHSALAQQSTLLPSGRLPDAAQMTTVLPPLPLMLLPVPISHGC